MTDTVDIATIHACQQGDQVAFHRIYEGYHRRIYALAYRYTHHPEEASDLTQEIFLRIYRGIGNFRGECSFETWIYRIAANAAISVSRKPSSRQQDAEEMEDRPTTDSLPEAQVEAGELAQRVEVAVAALPDSCRLAFVLVVAEHRSYSDVASILGLRVEAVRMRVSRARRALRESLASYLDEGESA